MDNRSDGCISLGSPSRAETTHHFPMNHRWTQIALTDVVGWRHIISMQEDKQALPVFAIPFDEPFFIRVLRRPFQQPVTERLQPFHPGSEFSGRQLIPFIVQMHGRAEHYLHGFRPKSLRIQVNHRLQVAQLMGLTQLPGLGRGLYLSRVNVRRPTRPLHGHP